MIFVGQFVLAQKIPQNYAAVTLIKPLPNLLAVSLLPKNEKVIKSVSIPFLSANYYANHLGFFCKQELKLEKVVKVPFKFRLGGVAECDKLEGKGNWRN